MIVLNALDLGLRKATALAKSIALKQESVTVLLLSACNASGARPAGLRHSGRKPDNDPWGANQVTFYGKELSPLCWVIDWNLRRWCRIYTRRQGDRLSEVTRDRIPNRADTAEQQNREWRQLHVCLRAWSWQQRSAQ